MNIKFAPSAATRNGFDFGVYDRNTDDDTLLDFSTMPSSSPSIDSLSTTGTESYVIDFNDQQFLDFTDQKQPAKKTEPKRVANDDQSSETRVNEVTSPTQNDQPNAKTDKCECITKSCFRICFGRTGCTSMRSNTQ